jgi:hypothetical protein
MGAPPPEAVAQQIACLDLGWLTGSLRGRGTHTPATSHRLAANATPFALKTSLIESPSLGIT